MPAVDNNQAQMATCQSHSFPQQNCMEFLLARPVQMAGMKKKKKARAQAPLLGGHCLVKEKDT